MPIYKKKRLDRILVDRGLAATRSQAADMVRRGCVAVEGVTAVKPGTLAYPESGVTVSPDAAPYVSRGGLKLEAALEAFGFEAKGRVALDLGASTGGFSDVLLARGAAKIYAVDVGRGQLHAKLRADPRVVALEATDARRLDATLIGEPVEAIVADVSFISLTLVLPAALKLAGPDAWLVALVKPQFEAGRAAVGKGGVVRNAQDREAALARVRDFLAGKPGWKIAGEIASPILGGGGNQEFLIGASHGA